MLELKEKHCIPLQKGALPLNEGEIKSLKAQLNTDWKVRDNKKLTKEFGFESFKRAMAFVQEMAMIAENEKHHPDICIRYSIVEVELTTHDAGGLSENDFIMAAKIEEL